jgi:hypothetical protein
MGINSLLSCNVYDDLFSKEKLLLIGSCVSKKYKSQLENFISKFELNSIVSICLEKYHYNQLNSKMFNILAVTSIKEVYILTPDGSPHCSQVHFAAKYLKRGLRRDVEFKHFVLTGEGRIFQMSTQDVDQAKRFANSNQAKEVTLD